MKQGNIPGINQFITQVNQQINLLMQIGDGPGNGDRIAIGCVLAGAVD